MEGITVVYGKYYFQILSGDNYTNKSIARSVVRTKTNVKLFKNLMLKALHVRERERENEREKKTIFTNIKSVCMYLLVENCKCANRIHTHTIWYGWNALVHIHNTNTHIMYVWVKDRKLPNQTTYCVTVYACVQRVEYVWTLFWLVCVVAFIRENIIYTCQTEMHIHILWIQIYLWNRFQRK